MKGITRKFKNQSGLTLVEILISVFILSVIITSLSGALVYATRVTKDNRMKTTAINLANKEIETIRSMKFLDVGTKNGDPSGDIPMEKEVSVDGITYIINTLINWEEQGDWTAAGNMDWDYKSVRVTVVPKSFKDQANLIKTVETYVTRDSTQPALTGGNIRVGTIRGWKSDESDPVSNIKVTLFKDSAASRIVFTTAAGVARFTGLSNGNYKITLDPSSQGMILNPSQLSGWDIRISGTVTRTEIFEVEYPCYLNLTMKNVEGDSFDMASSEEGKITLQVPYGNTINKTFNGTAVDSDGNLPRAFISDLWPVGDGYAGQYNISSVEIPDKYFLGSYEKIGQNETEWTGKFDGPGTYKNIICYFYQVPDTPSGIGTDWVSRSGSSYYIESGTHVSGSDGNITDVSVSTSDISQTLNMSTGSSSDLTAAAIYFDNMGSRGNSGLQLNRNSKLTLRTGMVVFRGKVSFSDSTGWITLRAEYDGDESYSPINGSAIGGTPGESYGKLFLEEPMVVNSNTILDKGGYYFRDDIRLPGAVVNNTDIIPITKDNYVE